MRSLDDVFGKALRFVSQLGRVAKFSEKHVSIDPCFVIPVARIDLGPFELFVDSVWLDRANSPGFQFDVGEALDYSDWVKSQYYDPQTVLKRMASGVGSE